MKLSIQSVIERNFHSCSPEYELFVQAKDSCRRCNLYDHYKQVVQSEGNANNPTFMIVGEAPGREEAEQNRPFIGPAGQILRDTFKQNRETFNQETTLISNVIPCRPYQNKFPTSSDPGACFHTWLAKEIRLVSPKVLVCLGNNALKYVRQETGITRCRGTWEYLSAFRIWSFASYHPSYVMRCRSYKPEVSKEFEQDFSTLATEYADRIQVTNV